jgi:septum formation inhibitor-activating ATPase MinD
MDETKCLLGRSVGLVKKEEKILKAKNRGHEKGFETKSKKCKSHQKSARYLSQGAGMYQFKVHRNLGTSKDCGQNNA